MDILRKVTKTNKTVLQMSRALRHFLNKEAGLFVPEGLFVPWGYAPTVETSLLRESYRRHIVVAGAGQS